MLFYHGTVEEELDEILPCDVTGFRAIHSILSDTAYAYATTSVSSAWRYAELSWNHVASRTPGRADDSQFPHVYIVEPLGEVESDPNRDAMSGDYRCAEGWAVVGELPTPDHWIVVEE